MTFIQVQGESSEHKGLSRSSQGPSGSPLDSTSDTRAVKMLTEAHYSCQAYMSIHLNILGELLTVRQIFE